MDGFSDIESSSSDVGAEVNEVETPEVDFGDGDGVNDFDDTYESMNSGDETLVYSQEAPETSESVENNSEDVDTVVDEQLNDFDDAGETDESAETPDATSAGDNIEQTSSDMTTDENIDNTLSDFDDESDTETTTEETGEAETESTADETEEADTEFPADETEEADTESPVDETGETETESASEEIGEADTESACDETGKAATELTTDETEEADTESASEETGETDTESTVGETDEADAESASDETGEAATELTADETEEADTESASEEIEEADTESTVGETDEVDVESASEEIGEADTESLAGETDEADVESAIGEASEADTESTAAETEEADAESTADETEEIDTESPADETDEVDVESASEETGEADAEAPADETGETETEFASNDIEETDRESAPDETGESDAESPAGETEETDTESPVDGTDETETGYTTDETDKADAESTVAENGETDIESIADEMGEADTENTADGNNETSNDNVIEGVEEASKVVSESKNGDIEASNIDGSNDESNNGRDSNTDAERDHTEKNAVFDNVSYHQGQNDLGALGTCGPTSIANSLNRVTGSTEYTENKVLHNAMDNNLCHKSDNPYSCGGTTTRDVVSIIDNVKNTDDNIHTEVYEYDKALSVDDLAKRLDDPGMVAMVGVDSATLWDQRGDVACSGLFQHTDSPSDHWITVDSPIRDETGNLTGFNIIDSGGGVSEVSREKFEAMYMGDAGHTVSDPTAVIISNNSDAGSSYSTPEGLEKTSNYKGSAEVSDGNDPPERGEIQVGVTNTECDINGDALLDEAKEINDKFRGDNFDASNSYEAIFNDSERKEIIEKNASTTCGLNENLDGKLDSSKFSTIDKSSILEVRERVPEIKPDTVMQKVIPSAHVDNYLNGDWTQVRNCCSKAEDTAPYISCGSDAYKELRLDYQGNERADCNVKELEQNADVYIIRFTSDGNHSDIGIPNDGHPCTGTGFTGSEDHLIPEYKYPDTTPTDGAIYKIDADGNETMVGMWDKDANRFYPVP